MKIFCVVFFVWLIIGQFFVEKEYVDAYGFPVGNETLKELRERYDGKRLDAPLLCGLDEASACVHCGVEE